MLTREEIEKMPAGPELNLLIGTELFGLEWRDSVGATQQLWGKIGDYSGPFASREMHRGKPVKNKEINLYGHIKKWLPDFSGDIAAAWLVWETCLKRVGPDAWARALRPAIRLRDCEYNTVSTLAIVVEHLSPLAICRATLLALTESATGAPPIEKQTQS